MNRHITRDYSAHKKSTYRPYDEFVKLEVFSFDPIYTRQYVLEDGTLIPSQNCSETTWKSWSCFKSADGQNDMVFDIDYNVKESGEYRVDVLYELNSSTTDYIIGQIKINDTVHEVEFDGVNNVIKRNTIYTHLNEDEYNITIRVPYNCYTYGVIIRKLKQFIGDNYFGDELGSEKGNIALLSATFTNSNMTKPSELSCQIAYDTDLECEQTPSGFYLDYMDEVNFYIKNNNREVERVFGGYVSSILPNSDRTTLTLNCADRLGDGENKYLLTQMTMQGGTKSSEDSEYNNSMTIDFESYPQALEYLSRVHETTLLHNISRNYTVDGEKYQLGLQLSFGSDKLIKKISATNGDVEVNNNFIMLRNKSLGAEEQRWTLYNANDYSKLPVEITDSPFLHITYGLGDPKTEIKSETTETTSNADTTAGSQSFNKCGVSADGKYLMAIGLPSAGKDTKKGFTKAIFKRKCPYCGSSELYWGYMWSGNFPCTKKYNNGSAGRYEGHIYCDGCDMDFSVQGWEHINGSNRRLTLVGSISTSSEEEANKLKSGQMMGTPDASETTITPAQMFEAITKLGNKYTYKLGSSSTYTNMKKTGNGDCWAFSELIFGELKRYGISCKIVQYATSEASNHRSVLYKDSNGNWTDFPYSAYGWNTMLGSTSNSKNGATIQEYKGQNMGNVNGVNSSTSTTTTTVTTTTGYDKDKPFQAYLKLTFSFKQDYSAKKYDLFIKFTQTPSEDLSINTGVNLYWVNDVVKKVKIDKDITKYIRTIFNDESLRIYLHALEFIAPKRDDDDPDWFKFDNTSQDFSSCKIQLYQIFFDNQNSANPSDLNSCGKTVNQMMSEIVDDGGYYVTMTYGLHRKDDIINYRVNISNSESFIASEGDNNNILSWDNISYNPLTSMHNMSMQVFKQTDNKYYYVNTRDPMSILNYGEQCTLTTSSDTISTKEAYFNAVMSDKYYPFQQYTYSITVPNYPAIKIGDLVKVIADAKKLNDVKEVKSIKIVFDYGKMPRIRTTLGLDELDPDSQLKENIRELRRNSKKETTAFSTTATPVSDKMYYTWDR